MLRYVLARTGLTYPSLVLIYAIIEIWKMTDEKQIDVAQWVVEHIHKPFIREPVIWMVTTAFSMFGTLGEPAVKMAKTHMRNNPPTHHDADKILFGIGVFILVPLLYWTIILVKRLIFGWPEPQPKGDYRDPDLIDRSREPPVHR